MADSKDAPECKEKRTFREYNILSYQGLFSLGKLVVTVVAITITVLTAYYTAEAAQDRTVAEAVVKQDALIVQQIESDRKMTAVLERIDQRLGKQVELLTITRESLIRVETRQQGLIQKTSELTNKVDELNDRVNAITTP